MGNRQIQAIQLERGMNPETCMACGSSKFSIDPTSSERFCLVQCAGCGVGFTKPKPTREDLEKHYSQTYYGPENVKFLPVLEKIVIWMAKRRARWIDKRIRPRSRVLEIGCGRGVLLEALSHLGHECHGTERSDLAATRAQRIVGIKVYTDPLEQCGLRENYFDVVILWHVLEHLENPVPTLTHISNLLGPHGILIIEVPNVWSWQARLTGKHWFHLDIQRHLYHFTAQGLNKLLERNGFLIIKITTFSWEQCPFGALQSFLNCLGLQPQTFYKLLKRELSLPFSSKLFHYSLAGLSFLPATLLAGLESLAGRGGVIRVITQKQSAH